MLNYGYSIIRAMIARSICSTGLHPTLGLFHRNQYNALCLADDVMEPFRPWVDWLVYKMAQENKTTINQYSKQLLLGLLSKEVVHEGRKMPLMIATHYLMANLKSCYDKERKVLNYPQMENRIKK